MYAHSALLRRAFLSIRLSGHGNRGIVAPMLRVKTEIMVAGWLRACQTAGDFATIARKGDPDAGIVAVKVYAAGGKARAFLESRDMDGEQVFRELTDGLVPEAEADDHLQKQLRFDRDLWIVEMENRDGQFFLEEMVLKE